MDSKEIINFIAKKRMTRYVQSLEIISFLISGFLLNMDWFSAAIMLLVGIFLALLAGSSAIEEYKLSQEKK